MARKYPDIEPVPDNDALMLVLDALKYEDGGRNTILRVGYVRSLVNEIIRLRPTPTPQEETT